MTPPVAKRVPIVSRRHGREIVDDYAWLRAPNWQEVIANPAAMPAEIRAYLDAETRYADAELSRFSKLRSVILAAAENDAITDAPEPMLVGGGWTYAERQRDEAEQTDIVRRRDGANAWQLLIEGDREAGETDYWDLSRVLPSPDHRRLAWVSDAEGDESYILRVRDIASGRDIVTIARCAGDVAWSADGAHVIYTALDDEHRPMIVRACAVANGTLRTIYVEPDAALEVYLTQPDAGGAILVEITGHETTEVRMIDARAPEAAPVLVPRGDGRHASAVPCGQGFLLQVHDAGAEDGRVLRLDDGVAPWTSAREIVSARDVVIDEIAVAGDWLVCVERQDIEPMLVARHLGDGRMQTFAAGGLGRTIDLLEDLDNDVPRVLYLIETPIEPRRLIERELATGVERVVWVESDAAVDDAFTIERTTALASDATAIPITLLQHRDTAPGAPILLDVYGAYGDVCGIERSAVRLAAAQRGLVFGVAHVRGGGELGARWSEAARGPTKPVSTSDYLACVRHLIATGVTATGRVFATGESAAGLVIGGALNAAPELFGGAVARVAFVDPLNTMLDASLPLTPGEWPEWGNPIEDAAAFDAIRAYSPYDNVSAQAYPPVLATASISDQRVTYWEPAKWIARLRERSTSGAPMILKIDWAAGHSGAVDPEARDADEAEIYAWVLGRISAKA